MAGPFSKWQYPKVLFSFLTHIKSCLYLYQDKSNNTCECKIVSFFCSHNHIMCKDTASFLTCKKKMLFFCSDIKIEKRPTYVFDRLTNGCWFLTVPRCVAEQVARRRPKDGSASRWRRRVYAFPAYGRYVGPQLPVAWASGISLGRRVWPYLQIRVLYPWR